MIVIVTLKQPNPKWNGLNVKRFEEVIFCSCLNRCVFITCLSTAHNCEIPSFDIANIQITY